MSYTLEMSEDFHCSRQADHVFDYITDFSRIDEWDHTIASAKKISSGKIGLGTEFEVEYTMGPRRVPIRYVIGQFEPTRRAVLVGTSKNFTATDTITIDSNSEGCHVNWHASIVFSGAAAKLIPLIKGKVIREGRRTINALSKALNDDFDLPKLGLMKNLADRLVVPGLTSFTKFGYQQARKRWNPVTNSVKDKHMVITGATSGLGLASAQELAHRGARLTLIARDEAKAKQVVKDLTHQTGNDNINVEIADLAEIPEVIHLGKRLLKQAATIDVLINNAGALLNPREENSDGIETSFALLLLGPVILTELLKPLLIRNTDTQLSSRVINVSSGGMYAKRISPSNLESSKGSYSGADAYARAKRGLVLAGEDWAQNWTDDNIIVHSMHPGWAQTPGVEKSLPEFNRKMQRTLRSAEQGADTIIWLACASEVERATGLFWLDREPHTTHLLNKTKESAEQRQQLFSHLRRYATRYDVTLSLGQGQ